jgi:uncharacterized surface protein with fasciclin (FAS1) repeats
MRTNRALAAVGAAAAAILLLTACGTTDDTTAAPATSDTMTAEAPGTIVDVASASGDFTTLVAAVQAADLVDTLNGDGPFTVFAPTDEAFAALPAGVLDALLLPENKDTLTKILTYHVVPGEVMSDQITDGDVATVEGQSVTISTADGVTVNGAMVITPDVEASNGVIHVIDAVLVPSDVDVAALTS